MQQKVSDLTIEELKSLIAAEIKRQREVEIFEQANASLHRTLRSPLEVPVLDVGEWPEGLKLISREEYYDDDKR